MATKKKDASRGKPSARGGAKRKKKCEYTFACKSPVGERLHSILSDIPELEECYLARGSITITIE